MRPLLRLMTLADHAAAHGLWRRTEGMGLGAADTEEQVGRFLVRNPGLSWVAERDGVLVGTALCGHDGRRGFIYHLAVDRESRGLGVGRALVERCVTGLEAGGVTRVHILVFAANEAGRAFWEHLGFYARTELLLCSFNIG